MFPFFSRCIHFTCNLLTESVLVSHPRSRRPCTVLQPRQKAPAATSFHPTRQTKSSDKPRGPGPSFDGVFTVSRKKLCFNRIWFGLSWPELDKISYIEYRTPDMEHNRNRLNRNSILNQPSFNIVNVQYWFNSLMCWGTSNKIGQCNEQICDAFGLLHSHWSVGGWWLFKVVWVHGGIWVN